MTRSQETGAVIPDVLDEVGLDGSSLAEADMVHLLLQVNVVLRGKATREKERERSISVDMKRK